MSLAREEAANLSVEQWRAEGILPFIAKGHMSNARELGLLYEDGSTTLECPTQHARFILSFVSPMEGWHIRGWEEASLSAGGAFPEALGKYSDGFVLQTNNLGALVIRADYEEPEEAARLDEEQAVAIKDIVWGAKLADLDRLEGRTDRELGPKEEAEFEPNDFYREVSDALDNLQNLGRNVEEIEAALDGLNGSVQRAVFRYEPSDFADHHLEQFSVKGHYEGNWVGALVQQTPSGLKIIVPEAEQVRVVNLNLSQPQTFVGVDNVPIETAYANFFFDPIAEEVNIVPQDETGIRVALDDASLLKFAGILRTTLPLSS